MPLLSFPFPTHVLIACPCVSALCPSSSSCLSPPEAGEHDVWVQLVRCPGRAAGVVPAGCLLLWSWGARPAAAEHRERSDAGGSSSSELHQSTLCFVSWAQHFCYIESASWCCWWLPLFSVWHHWPVLHLQVRPDRCEWAAEHCGVFKGFVVHSHALWRCTSL